MRSSCNKDYFGFGNAINQQPIGFDVAFPIIFPVSFKKMVFEFAG